MARPKRNVPWLDTRGTTYHAFWYDEGKRATERISLGTKDPDIAQKRFAVFLTEGKAAFVKQDGLTVGKALDDYYREHAGKEAVSQVTININIRHLTAIIGPKLMKTIGAEECQYYANARGVSAATVAKELRTLKAAAWHANARSRLSLADMPSIKVPRVKVSKGVWLFKDELQRLIDAAAGLEGELFPLRTVSFIELCYYTASRRDAIESLTWSQVDLERNRISLAKAGEKETKKRRPTIAIDPRLKPTLLRLKSQSIGPWVLGENSDMTYYFCKGGRGGGLKILPERDGRPSARLTPHMLRHSRATHLLQDGHAVWKVAKLLGDSITTVEAIYGHHTPLDTESLFDTY